MRALRFTLLLLMGSPFNNADPNSPEHLRAEQESLKVELKEAMDRKRAAKQELEMGKAEATEIAITGMHKAHRLQKEAKRQINEASRKTAAADKKLQEAQSMKKQAAKVKAAADQEFKEANTAMYEADGKAKRASLMLQEAAAQKKKADQELADAAAISQQASKAELVMQKADVTKKRINKELQKVAKVKAQTAKEKEQADSKLKSAENDRAKAKEKLAAAQRLRPNSVESHLRSELYALRLCLVGFIILSLCLWHKIQQMQREKEKPENQYVDIVRTEPEPALNPRPSMVDTEYESFMRSSCRAPEQIKGGSKSKMLGEPLLYLEVDRPPYVPTITMPKMKTVSLDYKPTSERSRLKALGDNETVAVVQVQKSPSNQPSISDVPSRSTSERQEATPEPQVKRENSGPSSLSSSPTVQKSTTVEKAV